MTADDVRARFEASMREMWGDDFRPERDTHSPDEYLHAAEKMSWSAYRTSHADLSGEVRELAADWRERVRAIGRDCGSYKQCADELEAALAKFTHQEKP